MPRSDIDITDEESGGAPSIYEADLPPELTPHLRRRALYLSSISGLLASAATSIYLPAIRTIERDFDVTSLQVNSTVASYVFGTAVFPIFWATYSETRGRRPVYLASIAIFTASSFLLAYTNSLRMMLVWRVFQAMGSSPSLTLGAGVVGDTCTAEERGSALSIFFLGSLIGPIFGPIIGGYVHQFIEWHMCFLILGGCGVLLLLLLLLSFPETLPRIRGRALTKIPPLSAGNRRPPIPNPLRIFTFMRQADFALLAIAVSVCFAACYLVTCNIPRMLASRYHLSPGSTGLLFISYGMGTIIGSVCGGWLSDRLVRPSEDSVTRPIRRLYIAYVGILLLPISLVPYGFFVTARLPLTADLVCLVVAGIGVMLLFIGASSFIVDMYPTAAASATACINFSRYLLMGVGALIAKEVTSALGLRRLMGILGALTASTLLCVLVVHLRHFRRTRGLASPGHPEDTSLDDKEEEEDIVSNKSPITEYPSTPLFSPLPRIVEPV